jgi:HK97 family phage major capsid protein
MTLQEMQIEQKEALEAANACVLAAEAGNRGMTAAESVQYNESMDKYRKLATTAKAREEQSTIRKVFGNQPMIEAHRGGFGAVTPGQLRLHDARSPEYQASLEQYFVSGGKQMGPELHLAADGNGGFLMPNSERFTQQRQANGSFSASLYEGTQGGSTTAGGYTVNVPTDPRVVPLAVPDLGIFDAAMVIETQTDTKIPQQASFGTAAIKAESSGTIATFGGTDPTLGQFTLSAFMAGALRMVSWELLQDVPTFQQFILNDLLAAQRILEGGLLATGTGSNQSQGVFGNVGTGTGTTYELSGTASTDGPLLLDSLFDVTATLKSAYQANASWILTRATGLAIRKAQMQANLFAPVFTTDADGTDRILGRPVFYDSNAPAIPASTHAAVTPILYGDFRAGYIVGVRGGAGINVKILDQPWANQGQLGILAYRRIDGRVRRSEAIQSISISHS